MLPPLASISDLETWRGSEFDSPARPTAILDAASTLVRSHTGRAWVDADEGIEEGVTDLELHAVQTVVLMVADRVVDNPKGTNQETTGPFSTSVAAWSSSGMMLTDAERHLLPSGSGTMPGLGSVRLVAPADARGARSTSRYDQSDEDWW